MRVCIVNGNPAPERGALGQDALERYLGELAGSLESGECEVTRLDLRDLSIRYCTGCWGCWTKTPGECVARDDSARVCREVIHSDFTLLASPVLMGYPSALLKKAQDKLIPLVHPYIQLVHGEAHHRARYERYPLLGILLHPGEETDDEDMRLITRMYQRAALNLKTTLALSRTTADPIEEVADEIGRL